MALEDKRELILVRLHAVLGSVSGIETNARNRGMLDNDKRPALLLLDGDESPAVATRKPGRVAISPGVMFMKPQVFLILKDPQGPSDETQGTKLNEFRLDIVDKVSHDTELKTLCGPNGGIEYLGCETDMKNGSQLKGQLRIDFGLRYVFNPYQQ